MKPIHPNPELTGVPLMLHNLVHQQGDCGAGLLSLVKYYIQRCCQTYYSLDFNDQQDIYQEASVKLLMHHPNIKYTVSKRWVYVMVKNLCIDALRSQRSRQPLKLHGSDDEDVRCEPAIDDFVYSSQFDNRECLDNVFSYLAAQPNGKEDLTVYSHYAFGLSRTDIAQITGRTVSAVTKRISTLRARLKQLRDELCQE